MAALTSIRRSMLVNLLSIVLVLSGTILIVTSLGSRQAVETLSSQLIGRSIDQIEAKLNSFFLPIKRGLYSIKYWGEQGLLDLDNPERLQQLFVPTITQYDQVSSLMVADNGGKEYMLLRTAGTWKSRITNLPQWKHRTKWKEWTKEGHYKHYWKEIEYNPRLRPWYIAAKKFKLQILSEKAASINNLKHSLQLAWTKPYVFFTTKEPGITASLSFDNKMSEEIVVGLDVLLKDISLFTTRIQVSEQGKVFIIDTDRHVVGLPADSHFEKMDNWNDALLKQPDKLGIKVLSDATVAYDNLINGYERPFKFESDGNTWWAGGKPYFLNNSTNLWIAVVIPESDLLGNLNIVRSWIVGISFSVLVFAIVRTISLARRYSHPLELLASQSKKISTGNLDSTFEIRSSLKEISLLAEAQENMRVGIRSLLKMERDLQLAQQIQRNTFPDSLPQIPGIDIYAWSDPADQAGGDTYDVIGIGENRELITDTGYASAGVFLLADATGHGIGPALSVTQVRAMLRMAVRTNLKLPEIAKNMNEQLCSDLHEGRFITAWMGELKTDPPRLISYSAGQAPLLHYNSNTQKTTVLSANSPPFGILKTLDTHNSTRIDFSPGDIYFVLSDGIYDAVNASGQQYGVERVVEFIETNCALTAHQLFYHLNLNIEKFCGEVASTDDKTGIIIKISN